MGVQTRSSAPSSPTKSKKSTGVILPSSDEELYKIFVLPSGLSQDARFVSLRNPRDGARCRYFFCPRKGLFEITKVNANSIDPRSMLLAPNVEATTLESTPVNTSTAEAGLLADSKFQGYVNKSAEVFVGTPLDPVFILLPLLDQPSLCQKDESDQRLFQPLDDLLDEHLNDDGHLRYVLTNSTFRPKLLDAMDKICGSVDAGDEQMFRLSMLKLYDYILQKAQRVAEKGLPASLEERFVTRALEVPMLSVSRAESAPSLATENTETSSGCSTPDVSESQSSAASTIISVAVSEASSSTTVRMADCTPSADLYNLQRLRTAMSFITASYLDPTLAAKLAAASLKSKASPDFGSLDEHLKQLAKLRTEALAARSISDFSKKRNLDDDEAAENRAEKKRRQEEEEKKKKGQESRGVKDLKKVDVSGMKKMSDFFAKKPFTAKPKS